MVVLSSPTAIREVVDKNSWAASSRPANYLAGLAAGGYHILFPADSMYIRCPIYSLNSYRRIPPLAALLRNLRKTIARFFSPTNALHRVPVQAAESTQLLYELMTQPEVRLFVQALQSELKG